MPFEAAQATRLPETRSYDRRQTESTAHPKSRAASQLHRTLGNQAFGRLLQTKLRLSEPGDEYEKEADLQQEERRGST